MKSTKLTNGLAKIAGRTGLKLKKHSPEILLIVGVAGVVGSGILACRATLKVENAIDNHRVKIDKIHEAWDMIQTGEMDASEYTETDKKKDLMVTYVQTTVDFIKIYGPAITLGIASISCIIGAHGMLKKRNVALMAAYKMVEEGFNAYRKRVIEEFGEEKDYMLKHGLKKEVVDDVEIDENGKAKKVKKTKLVEDPNGYSMYARFFDESSNEYDRTDEYNFMFLRTQQNYFNDILKIRGHVFLNEVYDALGLPRSQAGAVVGWALTKDGDNFIDFGIFDGNKAKTRDFVNGYERSILLDFNVDGVIYDLI